MFDNINIIDVVHRSEPVKLLKLLGLPALLLRFYTIKLGFMTPIAITQKSKASFFDVCRTFDVGYCIQTKALQKLISTRKCTYYIKCKIYTSKYGKI